MDLEAVVARLNEIAARQAGVDPRPLDGKDSLVRHYSFSSIDAVEFLLVVEDEFSVVIEDEDLSEELLESTTGLAEYIIERASASEIR